MEVEGEPSRGKTLPPICPLPCSLASLLSMNCRARAEGIARRLQTQLHHPGQEDHATTRDNIMLVPPDWAESLSTFQDGRSYSVDDHEIDAFHKTSDFKNLRPIHVVTSEPTLHLCLPQPPRIPHESPNEQDSDVHYDFDLVTPEDTIKNYSCSPSDCSPVTWELNSSKNGRIDILPNEDAKGAEKPESGCATSITSPIMFSEEYDYEGTSAPPLATRNDAEDQEKVSDANLEAVREILSSSSLHPLPSETQVNDSDTLQNINYEQNLYQTTNIEGNNQPQMGDGNRRGESVSSLEEGIARQSPELSSIAKKRKSSKKKSKHKKSHSNRRSTRSDSSGDSSSLEIQALDSPSGFHEGSSLDEMFIKSSEGVRKHSKESGMFDSSESATFDDRRQVSISSYEYCELCEKENRDYQLTKSRKNASNTQFKSKSPPKKTKSKSSRHKEAKTSPTDDKQIEASSDVVNLRTNNDNKVKNFTVDAKPQKYYHDNNFKALQTTQDKELQLIEDNKIESFPFESCERKDSGQPSLKEEDDRFPRESDLADTRGMTTREQLQGGELCGDKGKLFSEQAQKLLPRDQFGQVIFPLPLNEKADSLQEKCQQEQEDQHLQHPFIDSWTSCVDQVPFFESGNSSFRESDYELTVLDTHFSCLYGGSFPLSGVSSSNADAALPHDEGQRKVKETQPKTLAPLSLSSGYSSQTTGSSVSFSPPVWSSSISDQAKNFKSENSSKESSQISGTSSPGEHKIDFSLTSKYPENLQLYEIPLALENSHLNGKATEDFKTNGTLKISNFEFSSQRDENAKTDPSLYDFHLPEIADSQKNPVENFEVFGLGDQKTSQDKDTSDINCVSVTLAEGTSIIQTSQPYSTDNPSSVGHKTIPTDERDPKDDEAIFSKCSKGQEDENRRDLTAQQESESAFSKSDADFSEGSSIFSSRMKGEDHNSFSGGARPKRRYFRFRNTNSQQSSEENRQDKEDSSSTKEEKTEQPTENVADQVRTDGNSDLNKEILPNNGGPDHAKEAEEAEEIETLPENTNDNDDGDEEDIEEEALLTGKFKNIRKYSERVRRLSDDDDNLPPPPTQVFLIHDYYDEEEEEEEEAKEDDVTLSQAAQSMKISSSELGTELQRLEEQQTEQEAIAQARELVEAQIKERTEQETKDNEGEDETNENNSEQKEEKIIKDEKETQHMDDESNIGNQEECPPEVEVQAPSDDSARSSTEREVDDDLKLRIKRSSSLKCGKTPPDTPGRKKIVRFADALGLDLAAVRTFLEGVPNVPKSAFCDLEVELEAQTAAFLGHRGSLALQSLHTTVLQNRRILTAMFQQPGSLPNFMHRVREQKVCLENLTVGEDLSVRGIVRVVNLSYHKSVSIRYTFDNWKNYHEATATYVADSNDGYSDRFSFLLWGSFLQPNGALLFCIQYSLKGLQYWDNNLGANYTLQCYSGGQNPAENRSLQGKPQNDTNVLQNGCRGPTKDKLDTEFRSFMDSSPTSSNDPWATRFF